MLKAEELNREEITEKRKDPTEAEMKEYFQKVGEKVKSIDIKNGAREFKFEDEFSCIARDQKNADRKHQNWMSSQVGINDIGIGEQTGIEGTEGKNDKE